MNDVNSPLMQKLKHIRLLILDVDGVLTDGRIIYSDDGAESKAFNVKDGLGIRLLMDSGIRVVVVTGRHSSALRHRCRDLGIDHIFEGVKDKARVISPILETEGATLEETAFVGDDLIDLPLLRIVGVPIAVADAHEAVRACADMVTSAKGGAGAVREVCEAILQARGMWETILGRYS